MIVSLINRAVLETFFYVPKINWKRRLKPQGLNEQLLSMYRDKQLSLSNLPATTLKSCEISERESSDSLASVILPDS